MKHDIVVPSVGESVTQGILAAWLKASGESVEEGSDLFELETDKATVTVPAPMTGILSITVGPGGEVTVGQVVGAIETDIASASGHGPALGAAPATATAPRSATPVTETPPAPASPPPPRQPATPAAPATSTVSPAPAAPIQKPAAPRAASPAREPAVARAGQRRVAMTSLRKKIAARLVEAQHSSASLTTFNEVNMQKVSELRVRYKDDFEKAHGVKLGFMSFFVKACCLALAEMPIVDARIDGEDIVYSDAPDIGVAVSTERGLVVPVIRHADRLTLAQIEAAVADLATRARDRTIMPDELAGGTFSITNGGVFGSLLSTPLLNYPQAAILGMHTIQRRPIAEPGANGAPEQIVIRPMMYVALTYDHRLIDGKEAVSFLKRVKELVEDPWRLFIEA
jgi:2-oxoglutarate dehydrogenase E2 component (dihydrolipoamide succinyltransferase)